MTLFAGIALDGKHENVYILIYDEDGNMISKTTIVCSNLETHTKYIIDFIYTFNSYDYDFFIISIQNLELMEAIHDFFKKSNNIFMYYANSFQFNLIDIFEDAPYYAINNDFQEAFFSLVLGAFKFNFLINNPNTNLNNTF